MRFPACLFAIVLILFTFTTVKAQQSPPAESESEMLNQPRRPSSANSVGFQAPGIFQAEYGYDTSYTGTDFFRQESTTLSLTFAASRRLLLAAELDTYITSTDKIGDKVVGIGDTRLGFQYNLLTPDKHNPGLAVSYLIKLPSSSENKGLGSGRVDQNITGLVSGSIGKVGIDFNATLLIIGRDDRDGYNTGGKFALCFSHELPHNFGIQGELSGLTIDADQSRGIYALTAVTYQVNRRMTLDAGVRFGVNADAPRYGAFAGVSFAIADFYRHRK